MERKPAVKIGVKRKTSTGLGGTKRQKCECKNSLNPSPHSTSDGIDWRPDLDVIMIGFPPQ